VATILCLETATRACSVAVCTDGRVRAERTHVEEGRHAHAERLHPMVAEALREAGIAPTGLDAIAVGIGPGSYTGLRIGLSAAKGFAFALDIPIVGLGTLDILSNALREGSGFFSGTDRLHPMIDARRMEVFTGPPVHAAILDDRWVAALDPGVRHVVFGDGADKASHLWTDRTNVLHVEGMRPQARSMAMLAHQRVAARAFDAVAYLVPHYGKEAHLTRPRP